MKLYYVVEKQTQDIAGIEECTGWATVRSYTIEGYDVIKMLSEFDVKLEDSIEDELQFWLDNNGYEDNEYEMIEL